MGKDGLTRLVIWGIIAHLKEATKITYRVPMKALSDAYAPDYVESMILKNDIDKVINELEEALNYNETD